jgi:formimidoylglutamate deiminase
VSIVPEIQYSDDCLTIPGMATAHSHAFQRALRGRTQKRSTAAGSFWSWRGLMYDLVRRVTPQDMYAIARFAYTELAMSGVTAVGEFHYVHHDRDGQAYAERTELAEGVIRAARDTGIRICLIRTAYMRGGFQKEIEPSQLRFCDESVAHVINDVEKLKTAYAADPFVTVAVAAHSIRAVPLPSVTDLSTYASENSLPFHMHVCEQRRELAECIEEHGTTPVSVLADAGVLSPSFVGVHATHLSTDEIAQIGRAQSLVCLCRTTERDLGDGLPQTSDLILAGARICVGVDSHAAENAFEEIRAVELDERSRREIRHAALDADELLEAATRTGYEACGMLSNVGEDLVVLDGRDPSIAGMDHRHVSDCVVFGASPRAVKTVTVGGRIVVDSGIHVAYQEAYEGYLSALARLGLNKVM